MMRIPDISIYARSDKEVLRNIGEFVKHHRFDQGYTQDSLATMAGINRSTLVSLEKGNSVNLISLIQVLRVLKKLDVLESIKVINQISPIQVARLQLKSRQRVRPDMIKKLKMSHKRKSDW